MKPSPLVKTLLLLASSMTVMAGAIIAPALPAMSAHFGPSANPTLIKLVLTMPGLFIALSAPFTGVLVDRIGRKKVLLAGLALYGLAGSAGWVIDSLTVLLLSRAVLGLAVAFVMGGATTLIADYFEGEERTKFVGLQGTFMALGGVVFLNLGGLLARLHWRGPFTAYLLALVLLPLAARYLTEVYRPQPGAGGNPLRGLNLTPPVYFVYLMGFLGMLFFYIVPIQIPFYLARNFGSDSTMMGFAVSVATITGAVASASYSRVSRRVEPTGIFALTFGLMASGYLVIGLATHLSWVLVGLGLSGLGSGLLMPNSSIWLMQLAPPEAKGRVLGLFSSAIFLGQFASPLLVSVLSSFQPDANVFLVCCALLAVLGGGLLVRARQRKPAVA
jgi:MFS family permease